ncbi:hypothetical protein [Halococcus agarilyticus]|uniref:hypothetical protein n=1 Tax=Halococcus agarilyticus TaxID=1232219 RepID=UPI0006781BD5|nr:hypothetical protein [Halococcus agarilyticus]
MANIAVRLFNNVFALANDFFEVATTDPLSAILLLFGAVFVLFAVAVLGYLAAGALVSGIMPESIGRTPPQQGE